jgi:hypothetical protein
MHYINYRKLYNKETESKRRYIAKFLFILDIILVLQRRSLKTMQQY